ncbi:MAG: HupE/UreJ family protein [Methylococcaceae bacterium]|nr:HupE/UreJ family protein [Methylococcaceae bacterium]
MKKLITNTILLFLVSPACYAHIGEQAVTGLWQGLLHPFTGIDHILTILVIGMLATKNSDAMKRSLPVAFLCSMVIGFIISMANISFDFTENAIAISSVILGVWLLSGKHYNRALLLLLVSGTAIAHGYAHGQEVVGSSMHYLAGFVTSVCLLLLVTSLAFKHASPIKNKIQSLSGATITALGLFFILQG